MVFPGPTRSLNNIEVGCADEVTEGKNKRERLTRSPQQNVFSTTEDTNVTENRSTTAPSEQNKEDVRGNDIQASKLRSFLQIIIAALKYQ